MNDVLEQLNAIRARRDALDVRTAAFLCYLDVKTKQPYGGCETYLRRQAVRVEEREDFVEAAFWLWSLGEYAGAVGETDALREYAGAARKAVAVIGREWNRPHPHWLVPDGRAVWLGNLAIAAGGLRAASLHLQDEEAGRLLREIREFVFAEMMHQGGVVGALGSREITGDIGIAAVPFGLFNAGDLVLVAAVDWLEAHLANGGVRFSIHDTRYGGCVRPDLTALLAWYYSERGHLARAAKLLDSVRRQWERDGKLMEYDTESAIVPLYARYDLETSGPPRENELAYILYEIARLNLEQKSASGAAGGGVVAPSVVNQALTCLATRTDCGRFVPPHERPASAIDGAHIRPVLSHCQDGSAVGAGLGHAGKGGQVRARSFQIAL